MSSFWLVMRCSVAPGYDISVTVQRLTRLGEAARNQART